jgi:hypothetical protein
MPGANLAVLGHALDVDHESVEKHCDNLTLAMMLAHDVRIRAYEFG